jgi:hypothetical protein
VTAVAATATLFDQALELFLGHQLRSGKLGDLVIEFTALSPLIASLANAEADSLSQHPFNVGDCVFVSGDRLIVPL